MSLGRDDGVSAASAARTIDGLWLLWLDVAMTRVKIATLKDHLSEYLRAVEAGAEVVVTDRDRPIARISPMPGPGVQLDLVQPRAPFEAVRDRDRIPARWSRESTALLLEERGDR